jgi:adenosine deaminase
MDKILRDGLRIALLHTPPENALRECLEGTKNSVHKKPVFSSLGQDFENLLVRKYVSKYSREEAGDVRSALNKGLENGHGLYSLMLRFASECLIQHRGLPFIRYEELLRWRDTTHSLYALPFVCAFLAKEDLTAGTTRTRFSFDPMLTSDSFQIKRLLSKGMAENHFHLWGSAPAFLLNWIYLMNHVENTWPKFEKLKNVMLSPAVSGGFAGLHSLVIKAALIRAVLFDLLDENTHGDEKDLILLRQWLAADLSGFGNTRDASECSLFISDFGGFVSYLAHKSNPWREGRAVDYAIPGGIKDARDVFSGETRFLYKMFQAILNNDSKLRPCLDLFWIYLMIATRFRSELIQCNDNYGFDNFEQYQSRKNLFFGGDKQWEAIQVRAAAEPVLRDSRIRSFEMRIIPKSSAKELAQQIKDICRQIAPKDTRRWLTEQSKPPKDNPKSEDEDFLDAQAFFVLHFPKQKEKQTDTLHKQNCCRHHTYRLNLEKWVKAIEGVREGQSAAAALIRGIDACANEADTRPEVFAPVFRRLRRHQPPAERLIGQSVPPLRVTYHVGEDYPDIVDGLRAIEEAMLFLELRQGDRIGHAMALGVDAQQWYRRKERRIILSRQALLDNSVWMRHRLSEAGMLSGALSHTLSVIYQKQIAAIFYDGLPYTDADHEISEETYLNAWLLRGDHPECYHNVQDRMVYKQTIQTLPVWHPEALLTDNMYGLNDLRKYNRQAAKLIHHYHYNPIIKNRGDEIVEEEVTEAYIQGVSELQAVLRQSVARMHIGVEANPSSNVLIGNYKRYDDSPLLKLYDRGLLDTSECPQLSVSINTDDLGVFDTTLENEYALLALSLEKQKKPDGNSVYKHTDIYKWLDNIRKMGLAQSFLLSDNSSHRSL